MDDNNDTTAAAAATTIARPPPKNHAARPDHTWLIAGPQRSGSVFHLDPNATHAWNACIVGWKRCPPGVTPPGVHPSPDGDEVALPLSIGEWLMQFWTQHTLIKQRYDPSCHPLELGMYRCSRRCPMDGRTW
jgi:hypothetical protein